MVAQKEIIYNTDFISAGVGGMRDVGNGVISPSGISGIITKAYLYWHGVTTTSTDAGNSIIVKWSYSERHKYRSGMGVWIGTIHI